MAHVVKPMPPLVAQGSFASATNSNNKLRRRFSYVEPATAVLVSSQNMNHPRMRTRGITEKTKEFSEKLFKKRAWEKNLTPKESDALKRYINLKRLDAAMLACVCGLASFATVIIANEIEWKYILSSQLDSECIPYSDAPPKVEIALIFFQCLTTLCTILLIFSLYQFHYCRHAHRIISKRNIGSPKFFGSKASVNFAIECLVYGFHIPPGLHYCWQTPLEADSRSRMAKYSIQVINLYLLVRFGLAIRFVSYHNRFRTQASKMVMALYSQKYSEGLALKDFLGAKPRMYHLVLIYFGILFLLGYFVFVFERPIQHTEGYDTTFSICIWFIWNVFATVGLGDWIPMTPLGRVVAVVAGVLGTLVSSLIISSSISFLEINSNERKVVFTMNWLQRKGKTPILAASLIQAWWRYIYHNRSTVVVWKLQREMNRWRRFCFEHFQYKHAPTDPADMVPKVHELQANMNTLLLQSNDQNNNIATLAYQMTLIVKRMETLTAATETANRHPYSLWGKVNPGAFNLMSTQPSNRPSSSSFSMSQASGTMANPMASFPASTSLIRNSIVEESPSSDSSAGTLDQEWENYHADPDAIIPDAPLEVIPPMPTMNPIVNRPSRTTGRSVLENARTFSTPKITAALEKTRSFNITSNSRDMGVEFAPAMNPNRAFPIAEPPGSFTNFDAALKQRASSLAAANPSALGHVVGNRISPATAFPTPSAATLSTTPRVSVDIVAWSSRDV